MKITIAAAAFAAGIGLAATAQAEDLQCFGRVSISSSGVTCSDDRGHVNNLQFGGTSTLKSVPITPGMVIPIIPLSTAQAGTSVSHRCEDYAGLKTDEYGNCAPIPTTGVTQADPQTTLKAGPNPPTYMAVDSCPDQIFLNDVAGVAWPFATMTDDKGRCVFSVRNATVGKQHDEIVEKLGARIDALTEEISELRAQLGDDLHHITRPGPAVTAPAR